MSAPAPDPGAAVEMARVERALLWTFLAIRAVHLGQGVLDVASAYHSYTRPGLATAVLAACVADCAFLVVRSLPRGRIDPLAVGVDVAVGIVGLFAVGLALPGPDRTTSVNWMLPYTVGSVLALAIACRRRTGAALTAALAATYLASVATDLRHGGAPATTAVVNAASYAGFYVVAALVIRVLRRLVGDLHRAHLTSVENAGSLATERERNHQQRVLHDHAIQSLEAIAKGWAGEGDEVAALARQEAARLRYSINTDHGQADWCFPPTGLQTALAALVDRFNGAGLHVQLIDAELATEPSPEGSGALVGAAGEALNNVIKHAGVKEVVVRVASTDVEVEVDVLDHGCGFEVGAGLPGFGLDHSIVDRMLEVGGRATIRSRPGRGTKVTLQVPLSRPDQELRGQGR